MNLELQKGSRSKILAAILFGFMTVFSVRLFYLQIIQHDYYVDAAKREQVKRLTIPASVVLFMLLMSNASTASHESNSLHCFC